MSKLKPYLIHKEVIPTTYEQEEMANKRISPENYKAMSDLVIYENYKLCQLFEEDY